jgi:hypothetical protein
MRLTSAKFFIGMFCLAVSTAAYADSTVFLTLDGNFSSPDYAFYSYTDTSNVQHSSIPIGPYITYLSGSGFDNSLAYTFCYDFNSPTNVGTVYAGTLEVRTDTATMEATYLIHELNSLGLINAPLATRGAISMAIWEIMNPSSTTGSTPFPGDPAAQPYELAALNAVTGGSWTAADSARYPTWVPNDPSIQRFGMVLTDPTPEPATLALMGFGMIGLGVLRRRRPR